MILAVSVKDTQVTYLMSSKLIYGITFDPFSVTILTSSRRRSSSRSHEAVIAASFPDTRSALSLENLIDRELVSFPKMVSIILALLEGNSSDFMKVCKPVDDLTAMTWNTGSSFFFSFIIFFSLFAMRIRRSHS